MGGNLLATEGSLLDGVDEFGEGVALGDDTEAGDDDMGFLCHFRGKVRVQVVPRVGSLVKAMVPRCSVMMLWTTDRPKPVPCSLVVKNGSKTRARCSLGMP